LSLNHLTVPLAKASTSFKKKLLGTGAQVVAPADADSQLVPIQKQLFFDGRGQPSAVSDQPKQGKTGSWLNADR